MRNVRGFTLIETILFIVIVSIAVMGITMLFAQSVRHSHEPLIRQQAIALANAYMDEILHKRWDENSAVGGGCVKTGSGFCASGPDAAGIHTDEGSRSDYDDIDDYHKLSESPPKDPDGNDLANHDNFSVTVEVSNPDADWHDLHRLDVKRVLVTVTSPSGEAIALTSWRVNY